MFKYAKKSFLVALMLSSLVYAESYDVKSGWQLLGATEDIDLRSSFDNSCVKIVWKYDHTLQSWSAYSSLSDVKNSILSTSGVSQISKLNRKDGFWVLANSDTSLTTYKPYSLYDIATSFSLDQLANKTFHFWSDEITFDSNGFIDLSINSMSNCYTAINESNLTLEESGVLKNYWSSSYTNENNITEFLNGSSNMKVLAYDQNIGFVLTRNYFDENGFEEDYSDVIPMTLSRAVENPVDMSTLLPYTTHGGIFYVAKDANGRTFNSDGTITYFDKDGVVSSYDDTDFSIENGAIVIHNNYIDRYNESNYTNSEQIVFSIGDYDILKLTYSGISKDYRVYYYDSADNWNYIDLNNSIETFYDLFAITENRLNDYIYNMSNGTAKNRYSKCEQTFTISENGTKLSVCYPDGYCDEKRLENSAIINEYSYDEGNYMAVKRTPYFQY